MKQTHSQVDRSCRKSNALKQMERMLPTRNKSRLLYALVVLSLGILAIGCGARDASLGHVSQSWAPDQTFGVDLQTFAQEIQKGFAQQNQVKGYQVTLIQGNVVQSEVSGGHARREWLAPLNPNLGLSQPIVSMTTQTHSNVGSTTKVVAGIALLAVMEKLGYDVQDTLNKPIYNYLPKPWQTISHPSIQWITFRELLTHRSGFVVGRGPSMLPRLVAGVDNRYTVERGVTEDACPGGVGDYRTSRGNCHGVRVYNNDNFMVLGYLIAAFENPTLRSSFDNMDPNNPNTHTTIQSWLGLHFDQIMKTYVFDHVTPSITPSCDPGNDFQQEDYALMYSSGLDLLPGVTYSEKNRMINNGMVGHCQGQGGWYYSSRGLAHLLGTLESTSKIMSGSLYRSMFDPKGNAEEASHRLAWGRTDPADLQVKFDWNHVPSHGGGHPVTGNGRQVYGRANALRLPMGYHVVGIINSGGMESWTIGSVMRDAFIKALVPL